MNQTATRCGYVAIIGRPNVGKSTLLNRILGQKISITSRKPQTTRHRILGIHTVADTQIVFVDTPGMHLGGKRALNRYMNKTAAQTLQGVDLAIFVLDGMHWREEDQFVLQSLEHCPCPVLLVVNKVDQIPEKKQMLPHLEDLNTKREFAGIFPLSAKSGENIQALEEAITGFLPERLHMFPEDQITDRSERFLVAEIIREKLFRLSGQEVPYSTTVEIEEFKVKKKVYHISALILVEKEGQKKIFIGKKGEKLKEVGMKARLDIENLVGAKVFLQLWIKVKSGWADDDRALASLGYTD